MRNFVCRAPDGAAQQIVQVQLALQPIDGIAAAIAAFKLGYCGHAQPRRIDARERGDHVFGQSGCEIVLPIVRRDPRWEPPRCESAFPAGAGSGLPLFDLRNEAVTEARKSLNVQGALGLFIQSQAYLANTEIQTLLEIDKSVLAPNGQTNLFARDQGAAMAQQKCKNARWLLLQANGAPFLRSSNVCASSSNSPNRIRDMAEEEGSPKPRAIITVAFASAMRSQLLYLPVKEAAMAANG